MMTLIAAAALAAQAPAQPAPLDHSKHAQHQQHGDHAKMMQHCHEMMAKMHADMHKNMHGAHGSKPADAKDGGPAKSAHQHQ